MNNRDKNFRAESRIESVSVRANSCAAESQLVLSIFHGADLFGRGFEREGFSVVRAGEIDLGFDIRNFSPVVHRFDGIIGGTPCQDFSIANRTKRTFNGYGLEMLKQFARVITEAQPLWALLENVPQVPTVHIEGYQTQRFDLNARECGLFQNRHRHFQFFTRDGRTLSIDREPMPEVFEPCAMAVEGKKNDRRTFANFCRIQGLPEDFDLPLFKLSAKYKAVGNGVPPQMARKIAQAIKLCFVDEKNTPIESRLCACNCGRRITGRQKSAGAACRKRLQLERSKAGTNHIYL